MYRRWMIWMLLCSMVCPYALAQAPCVFTLSGNVSDADTREPLAYSAVELQGKNIRTIADSNGKYIVRNLCSGDHILVVSHHSCKPLTVKIRITQNTVQNVVLPHTVNELTEVRIVEKYDLKPSAIREELNSEALQLKKGLSLAEQLQHVAGVSMLQTGSTISKPVINGLHGNRLLIVTNGVRLESQQWGNDHAPEIDPFTAHRISVIKGAGALRYGSDALAGAIVIEPKTLPSNGKLAGEIQTGYFHNNRMAFFHTMLEKNLKTLPALSWRLQLSSKTAGNVRTPDYYLWNSGMREWNGSAMIGWRKPNYRLEATASVVNSTLGIFLGSQVGNVTDLNEAIKRETPLFNRNAFSYGIERPRQELMHVTGKVKHVYYTDSRHILHTQFSYQRNHRKEFDLAMITDKPELDLVLSTAQLDLWYEHKHDNWMHTYGSVVSIQENVWDGSRFFIPNYRSYQAAGYYIARYNKHKNDIEMGIRYDYRDLTTFRNNNSGRTSDERNWNNFSGTLNYQRTVSTRLQYTLYTGVAWRPPSINELYVNGLHHGTSSFEIGNAQLKNETGYKTGARILLNGFDSAVQFDVYVYNQFFIGFINLVPDTPATLTIRGAYPTFRFVQTTANLSGYDVKLTIRPTDYIQLHTSLSVVYAYDVSNRTWLAQMPGNRLNTECRVALPNVRTFTGNRIIAGVNSVFRQQRLPEINTDYALPPGDYHLLQLSVVTNLGACMLHAGINNALNVSYREYLNRFRYFNDEMGRNIFIKLNYTF
jgi:iron complex outermembrane receptor protein